MRWFYRLERESSHPDGGWLAVPGYFGPRGEVFGAYRYATALYPCPPHRIVRWPAEHGCYPGDVELEVVEEHKGNSRPTVGLQRRWRNNREEGPDGLVITAARNDTHAAIRNVVGDLVALPSADELRQLISICSEAIDRLEGR